MPLAKKRLDRHTQDFASNLTRAEVELLTLDPEVERVQCSSPIEPTSWDLLDEILFARRPEIELRLYGFHSSVCDLSFLHRTGNVRRFSAACLDSATGDRHRDCVEMPSPSYETDNGPMIFPALNVVEA
jgi:hypothetical protein